MGVFTKSILKHARPDAQVVCFEIDEKFCTHLSKKYQDKRLRVINTGAEHIRKELHKLPMKDAGRH